MSKISLFAYLSQNCNWLVQIKHVSSLEAIKELRVHSSVMVVLKFQNFVENIINKKSYDLLVHFVIYGQVTSSVAPLKSLYFHWTAICSSSIVFTARAILRTFKTSLVPINHEMHSRSYDFLYVESQIGCTWNIFLVVTNWQSNALHFIRDWLLQVCYIYKWFIWGLYGATLQFLPGEAGLC